MKVARAFAATAALAVLVAGACTGDDTGDDGGDDTGDDRGGEVQREASTAEVVSLPGRPAAVMVGGGVLWVADDAGGTVLRLDPERGQTTADPVEVGPNPVALAYARDRLVVAHAGGRVTIVAGDGTIDGLPIEVGGSLVDVIAEGADVWIADIEGGTVRRIDLDSRQVDPPIVVPAGAVRLAMAGNLLWVSNLERTVTPVDMTTGAVGSPVEVGIAPIGMVVIDAVLWVANSEDDTASRLDPETGEEETPARDVGAAPIAIAASGDRVWVVNQDAETATPLRRSDGTPAGDPVELGLRPRAVAVSPSGLWIVGVEPSGAALLRADRS